MQIQKRRRLRRWKKYCFNTLKLCFWSCALGVLIYGPLQTIGQGNGDILEVMSDSILPVTVPFFETFSIPAQGIITSEFGERIHPITGEPGFHRGIDIGAPEGTPIVAVLSGTVLEVGSSEIYGNYLILEHSDSLQTQYSHCSEILVKVGYRIKQNETIALVGNTGVSTGPHLHFDIKINGEYCDPLQVLPT